MDSSNIQKDFVVLSPDKNATPVANTPDVYERLDMEFGDFKGYELISCYSFTENWSSWEIHPNGDEIVVLLSGNVTFILDIEGTHEHVQLTEVGEYVIVPKGIWHTAQVIEKAQVLFITPGEGTENKSI